MERNIGRDGRNDGTGGRETVDFQVQDRLTFDEARDQQQLLIFHLEKKIKAIYLRKGKDEFGKYVKRISFILYS